MLIYNKERGVNMNVWNWLKELSEKPDNELRTIFDISVSENCDVMKTVLYRYSLEEAMEKWFKYKIRDIHIGDIYTATRNPEVKKVVVEINYDSTSIGLMNDSGFIANYTIEGLNELYNKTDINVFDALKSIL